ncbi:MAG: PQQ-dependent sugar dehydrogenase, partial [Verrucomicrobiae bacterium]|nr:PQQ-dependent sugar dehydrogenase [Verrucomicrobiae bacterium]
MGAHGIGAPKYGDSEPLCFGILRRYAAGVVRIGVFFLGWIWIVFAAGARQHAAAPADFASAASEARKFQLAPGLKLDVWAAEPQLSNSVAFGFDGRGRVFLAESDRWAISVFDITQHTNWLLEDMSFHNVADRAAFLTREFATNLAFLTRESEAVRVVEDRDGDGRADHSEVIASGFHSVVDGTAAGVLADRDRLYFANIPSLWRLEPIPTNAPSASENWELKTENLATGFGVHIGVSGHDFHGLIKGPDGRIYMSFGDRGACITNREGVLIYLPDTGGVLRCEPDGRNLEVFCYGLRNPQELAFDDFGNLWTVDNDTSGADPCRVLHLVEGGDYGWRTSYQHMEGFGPWVQEELWKGGQDGILPPAGTVSQGPSGLAFYPGTGFGERLKGTFLHADFPGGVWAFTVKPQGASYVVDRKEKFLWNCWPTDVDFGPDGGAYVLDWVSGWGQTPRGRIYRITPNPGLGTQDAKLAAETRRLLGEGMASRGEKELLGLLGHADRRVRLEAQWELAGMGAQSVAGLAGTARRGLNGFARLHALWGL